MEEYCFVLFPGYPCEEELALKLSNGHKLMGFPSSLLKFVRNSCCFFLDNIIPHLSSKPLLTQYYILSNCEHKQQCFL